MKNNYVLLLTGTINTSNVEFMKRDDTSERLSDYKYHISKWLKKGVIKVVFVENSNYEKTKLGLDIIENKNFEYLSYDGQGFSRSRGKGYGEISSFEYAFNNSKFIQKANYVIKCNGRYYFNGIEKLMNKDFYFIGDFFKSLIWMESKVICFKKEFFYEYFFPFKELINDSEGVNFEHALAKAVHKSLIDDKKWSPIPFPLIVKGYSGTSNKKHNNLFTILKIKIRYYLQRI